MPRKQQSSRDSSNKISMVQTWPEMPLDPRNLNLYESVLRRERKRLDELSQRLTIQGEKLKARARAAGRLDLVKRIEAAQRGGHE